MKSIRIFFFIQIKTSLNYLEVNSSCLCDALSVIFMFEFLEGSQSFPGQNGFIFGGTWVGVALINHACFHKISSNFPSRKYENPNKISLAQDPITYTEFEAKASLFFSKFFAWTYCICYQAMVSFIQNTVIRNITEIKLNL